MCPKMLLQCWQVEREQSRWLRGRGTKKSLRQVEDLISTKCREKFDQCELPNGWFALIIWLLWCSSTPKPPRMPTWREVFKNQEQLVAHSNLIQSVSPLSNSATRIPKAPRNLEEAVGHDEDLYRWARAWPATMFHMVDHRARPVYPTAASAMQRVPIDDPSPSPTKPHAEYCHPGSTRGTKSPCKTEGHLLVACQKRHAWRKILSLLHGRGIGLASGLFILASENSASIVWRVSPRACWMVTISFCRKCQEVGFNKLTMMSRIFFLIVASWSISKSWKFCFTTCNVREQRDHEIDVSWTILRRSSSSCGSREASQSTKVNEIRS